MRRPAWWAALLCAAALAPPAGEAKKREARPLEPVSTGNADGAFAAALDDLGRLHLAWVASLGEGKAELRYRYEAGPDRFTPAEVVRERPVEQLSIVVPAQGATLAWLEGEEAVVAQRDGENGWSARSILRPAQAVALLREGEVLRVHAAAAEADGASSRLTRTLILAGKVVEHASRPLTSPGGTISSIAAAGLSNGWDALLLTRRLPPGRILRISGEGEADPEFHTLSLVRLREEFSPTTSYPYAGRLLGKSVAALDSRPVVVWAEGLGTETRLLCHMGASSFGAAESLYSGPERLRAPVLATRPGSGTAMLAAIVGNPPAARLRVRWFDGGLWQDWTSPPGAEALQQLEPVALAAALGVDERAHVVVQEAWPHQSGGKRLVRWVALGGHVITLGK